MLGYHFDVDNELFELIGKAEKYIIAGPGLITVAIDRIYSALSKIRLYSTLTSKDQNEAMETVDHCLGLMEIWSQSAPGTFQHMYDLIRAEKERISGETDKAIYHYEQAIQGAHKVGFIHDEALANELYARFWGDRGNDRFAGPLMREAHSLYQRWGALAKADHLAGRYPNWLIGRSIVDEQAGAKTTSSGLTADLDLLTVLKASQDIAGEITLDSLLDKLMTNVLENSGAQHGYLILEQEGQLKIVAGAVVEDAETDVAAVENIAGTNLLAQGIVHYVARTQETVVLEDASQSGDFVQDPYVQSQQARSILCTPLINQGKTSGILYLENNLAPRVFSVQRVNLLNLLSAQMAISIDNARIHDHLEAVVAERTQELQVAKENAEDAKQNAQEANRAKSIFLANMSHELRTPLNAVLGFSRMLARGKNTTSDQQEKLSIINRSSQHLLAMINDILDLSKIEAGSVELHENSFDVVALAEEISAMIQSRTGEKGLSLVVETETVSFPYIKADMGKLRHILINLLSNAVKFTDEGGVTIRCDIDPIPEEANRCFIVIEVEDTGLGIDPARQAKIFEPFVQGVDEPVRRGTGLGLSICKKYTDFMGGTIELESEVGKGSLFRVRLPAEIAEVADFKAPVDDKPRVIGLSPTQKTWRILVADDNRANLLLLKSLLKVVGFYVLEAKNGKEAVEAFKKESPDLIWMDMRMPVMDGYEATRKIRNLAGGEAVKIVAITASAFKEQRPDILAAGCDEVVYKPFLNREIFETMARLLDIQYRYAEEGKEATRKEKINLTADMLADLPGELLQELRETTLALNREAAFEVIARMANHAPEVAAGLRELVDYYQMVQLRDLLGEVE